MNFLGQLDTTVVIPTKNRIELLKRAVFSVLSQKVLPKEIIIIDDASEQCISDSYFSEENVYDVIITIIRNNESLGGSTCRNIGVENSDTNYVSFLDDDDFWDANYLYEVARELERNEQDIAAYSSKKFVLSNSLDQVYRQLDASKNYESADLFRGNVVGTTSSVTVARTSFLSVGGFDDSLPAFQDYDLWLRLSLDGVIFKPVINAYVHYTISISSSQISGDFNNHIAAAKIIRDKYKPILEPIDYLQLDKTISFFVAKAVHRKDFLSSLKYSFNAIVFCNRPKAMLMLIPYPILNKFGFYTS